MNKTIDLLCWKLENCVLVSIKQSMVLLSLEIGNLGRLQLKLQFVGNKGDELRISGFSLGIADGIPEKSLQGIQIPAIPGHFDGMADGPLHAAGGGLEGLCHLGVQDLGDGVGVLSARLGAF